MKFLGTLHFLNFDSRLNAPIPDWANFYLSLGFYISQESSSENRKVVVLSVPTRSFCSTLIVAGAISYMAQNFDDADLATKENYFRYLSDLPDGTGLMRRNPKTRNIETRGHKTSDFYEMPEGYIGYQSHKGTTKLDPSKNLFDATLCWNEIELDPSDYKLPQTHKKFNVDDGTDFRSYIFGNNRADKFYKNTSTTECLVIGEVKLLESEVLLEQLIVPEVQRVGAFQDIIRANTLVRSNLGFGYKTKLLTDRINTDQSSADIPKLTVFDNPRAFVKWNTSFTRSNTVVILDRTDPHFDDSVLSANQEFENRPMDLDLTDLLRGPIPYGVDIMAYYARVI